ncbi:MAG: hypothetical protein LQ343_002808 [Gyalolechia ehrenbergii]|nr:MAG: hypothetical protein LQ343_002808 [Gyalolechia ehrenbergii]
MGAARIYSANRRRRKDQSGHDEQEGANAEEEKSAPVLGLVTSRSGHLIATVTATTMTIWQASPIVVLAAATRSTSSIGSYGPNVAVLLRPDASIAAVQTLDGFLVTYSITLDQTARVYQQIREGGSHRKLPENDSLILEQDRAGFREVSIKFRMVIRIDAGIAAALALDDEVIVATKKPAAIQCIKWTPDNAGRQTSTELTARMVWMQKSTRILAMVYDRAMSLAVWITLDGRAYAVQRLPKRTNESEGSQRLFRGYGFHDPRNEASKAVKAAINARFSLLAIGCAEGEIHVYTARDYVGSIPMSHKLLAPASFSTTGQLTCLSYSPDGYCLVAGYEHGWAMWSAYGKPGASSFGADAKLSETNNECWLMSVSNLSWINAGFSLLLTCVDESRLWAVEMTKSSVTTCFSSANISRMLLLSSTHLMIYRGFDLPVNTTISAEAPLWQHVAIPEGYLINQRPIRSAVISVDGRYVAIAGKKGLAHYSVSSGRWKTFDNPEVENSFVVRGGMCWYQHVLMAAVESDESYELRMYSRELGLDDNTLLHLEQLPSAAVAMSMTGQDSLLVYTSENVLYHYIVNASDVSVKLVQVGQLALNGIVRAPARVRAVTWILPEFQLRDGDPSQDVAHASVLFLVDAKLVLLQSSTNENGLKYDMRVIAQNVEYFDLMRDQGALNDCPAQSSPESPSDGNSPLSGLHADRGLRDSLWYFDGESVRCWMDVEDLLKSASTENDRELPQPVTTASDFYPTSIVLDRGLVLGLDAEMIQRRDVHFAYLRHTIRTQLFLPHILRRHLSQFDPAAASVLALRYQKLPYFSHALEVLLHMVLDDEVDANPDSDDSLMPNVVSFLSTFPDYLDIVVQCTRKTEVRSWRTLFAYLPPPQQLFEESLRKGLLKTAGGYLLVLHTFQELETSSEQCMRLFEKAKEVGDWDLCKELARFLMALDESGNTLREALARMNIERSSEGDGSVAQGSVQLTTPRFVKDRREYLANGSMSASSLPAGIETQITGDETVLSPNGTTVSEDYFSSRSG